MYYIVKIIGYSSKPYIWSLYEKDAKQREITEVTNITAIRTRKESYQEERRQLRSVIG